MARRLGELALQAEHALGGPQDLEWAIVDGRIYLLQSRPITTLHKRQGVTEDSDRSLRSSRSPGNTNRLKAELQRQTTWSNMNSWEILPDVVTPMTWSVATLQIQSFFNPLMKLLAIDPVRHPLFGLIAGRAYANLDTFAELVRALPWRLDFTQGLGGQHGERLAALVRRPSRVSWRQRVRRALRWPRIIVWAVGHAVDRRSERHLAEFRRHVDRLAAVSLAGLSERDLLRHLAALLHLARQFGPDTAAGVAVATTFVHHFFKFINDHFARHDATLANRMLGGLNGLASAEAGLDLWRLAAWTRRHQHLSAIVAEAADFAALYRQLAGMPEGQEFLRAGTTSCSATGTMHLAKWTFITPAGRKRRTRCSGCCGATWTVCPATSRRGTNSVWRSSARRWPATFRRQLGNCFRREAFEFLYRKAQIGIALRENARNECVRMLAAVRKTLLELSERLVRRGVLAERNDIFFIELAELEPLLAGAPLGERIAVQKAEFARNQAITPPPIVVGQFDPDQSPDGEKGPLDRVLHGLAASAGVATGPARVVLDPRDGQRLEPGEILIAPHTDPGWTPYLLSAAGIVMDVGGMLSHGTIVAREYGIPAVVNVGSATRTIKTGQIVRVDGDRGVVTIEEPA